IAATSLTFIGPFSGAIVRHFQDCWVGLLVLQFQKDMNKELMSKRGVAAGNFCGLQPTAKCPLLLNSLTLC
ncbi:MAG: hypothetical protein WCK89_21080, partial [bacterium]